MIVNGWVDWAVRLEPTNKHVDGYANPCQGLFMHSADGYWGTLLDPDSQWGYNGQYSWQFTNLMAPHDSPGGRGSFFQHYPLTAQCWHATAANGRYNGCENEGKAPQEASLNQLQIDNAVRLIRDLEAAKGWKASRPRSPIDVSHTLWEHNEVVRLGGSGTSCPSGRIPWSVILGRLQGVNVMIRHNWEGPESWHGLQIGPNQAVGFDGRKGFGLPPSAKEISLQVFLESGTVDVMDGASTGIAGTILAPGGLIPLVKLDNDDLFWFRGSEAGVPTLTPAVVRRVVCLGYTE